ncbi:MAG: PQQ-binding-like beta-propeller repeat protein, partial [Acidobacteria bacterium]|nr:PQQ-binding-like beta-propeller repeat protein [Acidobacteriota bacterium]
MRLARRRRTVGRLSGLVFALVSVLPADAQDWPQFRGNPQLTGVAAAALPASLKLLWTYEAGQAIESSAAIAGRAVYVGCFSGELISLDLATGKLRWKYKTDGEIGESSPAVSGEMVYVGDLSGWLHAVGVQDGKRRWSHKTRGEIKA